MRIAFVQIEPDYSVIKNIWQSANRYANLLGNTCKYVSFTIRLKQKPAAMLAEKDKQRNMSFVEGGSTTNKGHLFPKTS